MSLSPLCRPKEVKWAITSKKDPRWDRSGISTVGMIFQMPGRAKDWLKKCENKHGKRPNDLEYVAHKI